MKKYLLAGTTCLLFVAASASAIELGAEAGRRYTNLTAGMGTATSGVAMSGNWARSNDDGNVYGLGLGYNLPLGPVMATLGAKGLYLNPDDGKNGGALALGGGLSWPLNQSLILYGEGYVAPDSFTSGVKSYSEANAGVRWNVVRPLNLTAGYRYMSMEGRNDRRDNTLVDGLYVGAGLNF